MILQQFSHYSSGQLDKTPNLCWAIVLLRGLHDVVLLTDGSTPIRITKNHAEGLLSCTTAGKYILSITKSGFFEDYTSVFSNHDCHPNFVNQIEFTQFHTL